MSKPNFTCVECGKEIYLSPSRLKNRKYCSSNCLKKNVAGNKNPNWKGGLIKTNCLVCEKEILTKLSHQKAGEGKYCSYKCMGLSKVGKPPSHSTVKRVVKKCLTCGKTLFIKRSQADTAGFYCSLECRTVGYKTSKIFKGKNNPNWHGGKVVLACENCGDEYLKNLP